MKNTLLFVSMLFSLVVSAQVTAPICDSNQVQKEARIYLAHAEASGDRVFVGVCLEKAIKNIYLQESITRPNLVSEQQAVLALLRSKSENVSAAQIKAEIFEASMENDEAQLDEEADLKRMNPLFEDEK